MGIKEKSDSASRLTSWTLTGNNINRQGFYNINWSSRIVYEDGPKYAADGHCRVKNCRHYKRGVASIPVATAVIQDSAYGELTWTHYAPVRPTVSTPGSIPTELWAELRGKLREKIDLNCHDRVMAYSYVADLIPMLGIFTRASSVLNHIGRWVMKTKRSLRNRPFFTVLREAASLDLINRFVIQTTIKDTKQILDAYERCVRAFGLAHHRNIAPTVLTATAQVVSHGSSSKSTKTYPLNASSGNIVFNVRSTSAAVLSGHVVAAIRYNTRDADPVKWVMHALGIDTPLESVWDKIPFSFVVDYFFRIGDFISHMADLKGQDALRGEIVRVYEAYTQERSFSGYEVTGVSSYYMNPNQGYFKRIISTPGAQVGSTNYARINNEGMLSNFGFWDMGGLWSPRLSSVRKRTLLELGLQIVSR